MACGGLRSLRVLVTGSSRGLGFYIASYLGLQGARVVVNGRDGRGVGEAVESLRSRGVEAWGVVGDVATPSGVRRVIDEAWGILGGLDALVFNVGNIGCEPCLIHEAGYEDWVEAASLYLVAPGYATSVFVEKLLSTSAGGSIVYVSSVSVVEPMRLLGLADVARAGLTRLAKLVARTYGSRGVRANVVLYGSFDTPGARRTIERIAARLGEPPDKVWEERVVAAVPCGRTGTPEEAGAPVAFLLSPSASYINGAALIVDCGMSRAVPF